MNDPLFVLAQLLFLRIRLVLLNEWKIRRLRAEITRIEAELAALNEKT